MRQVKEKWPVNCSRSCARKAQHKRNHKNIRIEKKCKVCDKHFTVVNWDKDKKYCSVNCASRGRFGDRDFGRKSAKDRVKRILRDEKFLRYIKSVCKKIVFKWGLDPNKADDIFQEYILDLLEGKNTTVEHVSKEFLRKELKKGITGKHNVDFYHVDSEVLKYVKAKSKFLESHEFIEYMTDLMNNFSDSSRELIFLFLKGLNKREAMNELRKKFPISNDRFYKESRLILEGRIGYNLKNLKAGLEYKNKEL